MKTSHWTVMALLLFIGVTPGQAQIRPSDWQSSRLLVTRAELHEALERQQSTLAEGPGRRARVRAEEAIDQLQARLDYGDFFPGDRIYLEVQGLDPPADSVVVEQGPSIYLANIGSISLRGVLRSELEAYLTEELGRFIREPVVRARAMIRLTIDGGVGRPGYHSFPADLPIGDALMTAGGPVQNAEMDKIMVRRGDDTVLDRDEFQMAVAQGRSLDQLSIQPGDEVVVPVSTFSWKGEVLRYGLAIATSVFIGTRIFR
jgi:protein involved in polysaccharide export with SLBB domain